MKRLLSVIVLTLAINFLAALGGVGYLFQSGKLNKEKIGKVKEIVFAPVAPAATTQPSSGPTTKPGELSLSALLANRNGKTAIEQVDFLRRTFDTQMLELDRKQRELADLQRQVDLANQKLAADRTALEKREKDLASREQQAQKLQDDQGFQTSLSIYNSMPPKQVKSIFMTLDEATVQQYFEAMDARTAGKIIKEFKTPDETAFIKRVQERIRQAQLSTTENK
jgi:hypothetical protein